MKNYVLGIALFVLSIALSLVYLTDLWIPIIGEAWLPYAALLSAAVGLVVIIVEAIREPE